MTVIYIDVLIILNIYVTFFLIKATCIFLHKKIRNLRLISGALFGGFCSLFIFLPELPFFFSIIIKIVFGLIIVLISFGFLNRYEYLKNSAIFIIINLLFAGFMLVVWLFTAPLGMFYNNGFVYFDISFSVITVSTVLAYGIIKLLRYFLDTKISSDKTYNIVIRYNQKEITISAFADTGNNLTDFFTGLPVVVCDSNVCNDIIPAEFDFDNISNIKGVRFLPFSTVGSSGLLPVFRPESIIICDENGIGKQVSALIGISKEKLNENGVSALFNPKLLI